LFVIFVLGATFVSWVFQGCAPKADVAIAQNKIGEDLSKFAPIPIGAAVGNQPWVAHVLASDLDQDGRMDVLVCESKDDTVLWLHQTPEGDYKEIVLADDMRAPVHVDTADMDKDGDLDLLVACMSIVFPNNDRIGAVIALENDGTQHFKKHILLENTHRVTDVRAADLNGDGQLDLAVGQFGYDQGEVRWMERTGPWEFKSHSLLELSGTINTCVADFDDDGDLDIVSQFSQQWEEIYVFINDGRGNFTNKLLWGSTNEDYSSSGMTVCDLNQDGLTDILFTNGDGFGPTPVPGPQPWHGVQWLENQGNNTFEFHRIGDLGGAYSPKGIDLDSDGDLDVLALSSFNNWGNPKAESMVWFKNDGGMNFTKRILAYTPTHLLTVDMADFDGSGKLSLVTGGFHAYPPYDRMSRVLIWKPAH
jgi:hypothetical protein